MAKTTDNSQQDALWKQAQRRYADSMNLADHGRMEEACTGLAEAATLFRAANNDTGLAQCIHAMGVLYLTQDDVTQALQLFSEALRVAVTAQDREGEAVCRESVGVAHYRLEDYPAAQEQYARALVLYGDLQNSDGAASVMCGLGDCLLETQQFALAMDFYGDALELYTVMDDREGMLTACMALADGASAVGNGLAAIRYLEQAQILDKGLGRFYAAEIKTKLQELGAFSQPQSKRKRRR